MRIVGVDPSLTSTGIAVVHAPGGGAEIIATRVVPTPPDDDTLHARALRIHAAATGFVELLDAAADLGDQAEPLLCVLETRDFQTSSPGKATDRAGLWWQLALAARAYGAHLVGVAPTTLKVYATGDGRAAKEAVHEAVESRYGRLLGTHDEADALTLAAMAADWYGRPLVPVVERCRRTIGRPRWPQLRDLAPAIVTPSR